MINSSAFKRTPIFLMIAVLAVSGCGGGGDGDAMPIDSGSAEHEPGPPMGGDSTLGQITNWIDNPLAEDLLEHWNDPEVLRVEAGTSGLGDAEISARISSLKAMRRASGGQSNESLTLLRNVNPDTVMVVGEHHGITFGQWKSGPAGTLDIDFDYRFAPELDESGRAYIERAGKSWSWRLPDDFGTRTVRADQIIAEASVLGGLSLEELRLDAEVVADGLPIFVDRHEGATGDASSASSGGGKVKTSDDGKEYEPLFGAIRMARELDRFSSRGNSKLMGVIAHEIGHVLGITTHYDELVDEDTGTFIGPNSVAAHGGPVPFQWLGADGNVAPPGTPGAEIDYAHPGPCTYVMSYCGLDDGLFAPSELDFAYLADIGYEVLEAGTEQEAEVYGFGAWGRYGTWGTGVERTLSYEHERTNICDPQSGRCLRHVTAHDSLRAGADAFGIVPNTDFAAARRGVTGSVSWSGSLLGVDLGQRMLPPVFGEAELNVELSDLSGTARFHDLTVVVDGKSSAFRSPDLQYGIDVASNTFSDADGHIEGRFFGPAHDEMAGVLHDTTSNVNMLAGFGGARD